MQGLRAILVMLPLLGAACASLPDRDRAERRLDSWNAPELTTFESRTEFRAYMRDYRRAYRARHSRQWTAGDGAIIITGSRIMPSNPSITNVQEAGVDEGDIVKQIGRFFVSLQDGRLFVVDTAPGGRDGLELVDRMDVYTDPRSDMWYDEILVRGDRILVTGYSYDNKASEFASFRLGEDGRLTRENLFHIRSGDYYARDNSATRLIDGNLVIYTTLDLGDAADRQIVLPVVAEGPSGPSPAASSRTVLDYGDIYRPLVRTLDPMLHAVTVCPLGTGPRIACRTRAFVAASHTRYYVTPDDVFLWIVPSVEDDAHLADLAACMEGRGDSYRSLVYRIPVTGAREPTVLGLHGAGSDRFSLDVLNGRFRALTTWVSQHCGSDIEDFDRVPFQMKYVEVPLSRFDTRLRQAPLSAYAPIPPIRRRLINRFTDSHLVYGRIGDDRRFYVDFDRGPLGPSSVVVVPLARPGDARILEVPHNLIRAERAGNDVVLTGYADPHALNVTLMDLGAESRVGSTMRLEGRFESEGRSVAFNAVPAADGAMLMGLPTVPRLEGSERWPWRSTPSDLTYLAADANGRLRSAGLLASGLPVRPEDDDGRTGIPGDGVDYVCHVSCIDWYGNSRPIFTGGRIFALSATRLIEGRMIDGEIREIRRLDLRSRPSR